MTIITKRRSFLTGSIAASAAALLPLTVKAEAADKIQWSKTYDVVVVGSGGAGLSAGGVLQVYSLTGQVPGIRL